MTGAAVVAAGLSIAVARRLELAAWGWLLVSALLSTAGLASRPPRVYPSMVGLTGFVFALLVTGVWKLSPISEGPFSLALFYGVFAANAGVLTALLAATSPAGSAASLARGLLGLAIGAVGLWLCGHRTAIDTVTLTRAMGLTTALIGVGGALDRLVKEGP